MVPGYLVVAITVVFFVAAGLVFVFFPLRVLEWVRTVLLPFLTYPVFLFEELVGLRPRKEKREVLYEPTAPNAPVILLTRLAGVLYILIALVFLSAVLGLFR